MSPTGAMLREFQRLEREAREVAYSRDEYYQLVFSAAVKLAAGEWSGPDDEKCRKSQIVTLKGKGYSSAIPQK